MLRKIIIKGLVLFACLQQVQASFEESIEEVRASLQQVVTHMKGMTNPAVGMERIEFKSMLQQHELTADESARRAPFHLDRVQLSIMNG